MTCMIIVNIRKYRMIVMLNEEKISLMTKLALYEQKEGKKQIPMSSYYKGDYVSLNVLNSAIIGTIAYLLIVATVILINAEDIVERLTEIDLIAVGKQILTYYLIFIVCYLVIAYIFYSVKFKSVRVKLNQYNADLKQLYEMYKADKSSKDDAFGRSEASSKHMKKSRAEKEKTIKERPVKERTVKERTVKERIVKERSVKEKFMRDRTVREGVVNVRKNEESPSYEEDLNDILELIEEDETDNS